MATKIKGKDVKLSIGSTVVANGTNCSLSITTNTTDAATKDDTDAIFDNPEITSISWSMNSDSLMASQAQLKTLMQSWIGRSAVNVTFKVGTAKKFSGCAIIENIKVDATNKEDAKLTISFAGNGPLVASAAV